MDMKLKKLLGARIKELRNGRGLSQEQLAERLEIDTKHLSRLETGVNAPTIDRLELIASVLDVDVHSLFEYGHLDSRCEQVSGIEEMLKQLDENDVKFVYRIVRSLLK